MLNVVLNFTENPAQDIPQGKQVLFHDGNKLEMGFRKGDVMIYGARLESTNELRQYQININWVKYFVAIEK